MNYIDIAIVVLLLLGALQGYAAGLIQGVCGLFGLLAGISIASWNYRVVADRLAPNFQNRALADAIWFCVIALAVMIVAGLIGMVIKKVVHGIGLGWLDRIAGLLFGLLQGALLITLCIVTLAAFFPSTTWLADAQLAKYFLGTTHLTVQITPKELKRKVEDGLQGLEAEAPNWLRVK